MRLEKLLSQKRSSILDRWLQLILETYPGDTQRFLRKQKDQFANPVGYTISREIENLYQELLQGAKAESVSPILDSIIRIRAVQDFTPSQAVAFIFVLKKILREDLEAEIREHHLYEELLNFESRIDLLGFLAFDLYMKCREKIYEIKANEAKNQVSRLLQKAGLTVEIQEWKPDLKKGNAS